MIPPDEARDHQRHASACRSPTTWPSCRPTTSAAMDAEILIALKPGHHPTAGYMQRICAAAAARISRLQPSTSNPPTSSARCSTSASPAPIDVQVQGSDLDASAARWPATLRDAMRAHPGHGRRAHHAGARLSHAAGRRRPRCAPRSSASAQQDVANSLLISLSSSSLVAPSFFLNPANNVNYFVVVKVPLTSRSTRCRPDGDAHHRARRPQPAASRQAAPHPINLPSAPAQTLGNVAAIYPETTPSAINHYTVQRVLDVEANVEGRDLGSVVARHPARRSRRLGKLPPGMRHQRARPERGHGAVVPQPGARPGPRDPARLSPDGRAVPVLARPFHHHDRGARRAGRHPLDAGPHRHHAQRRVADGRDHGGGHRGLELDPARELRQRSARRARPGRASKRRSKPARRGCARCS